MTNTLRTISVHDFDLTRGSGDDTTPAVRHALADLRKAGGGRLVFPKDQYHFWPNRADEHYLFMSNNDEGLKRIAFPLFGASNIEIDGEGSEFVFHGRVTPFALRNAREIKLTNFSIDWVRPFHSEVEVLAVHSKNYDNLADVDIRIPEEYPYAVRGEQLRFIGEEGDESPFHNALEFDPLLRETAFRVYDNYGLRGHHSARDLGPNTVRLSGQFGTVPTPGNILAIEHSGRHCPAMTIADCSDVDIRDVTIHHAGAMGVIAQRTRDIRLERVRVTPPGHKGRLISTTADATHFVNCRGVVELTDCLFEGQLDDPSNVHGIYARISRLSGPNEMEVELVHSQQVGIDITDEGDTLEFVNQQTLSTYHQSLVSRVQRVNKQHSLITLAESIPDTTVVGDAVASVGWTPDLTIRGCTTRNNRARGFLISTPGKVLVENNYFHNPGAAILIAGDANFWFESGAVRDVTIRNNHFDNCNYGVWGRATIDINPEIEPENRGPAYHRNITIEGNTFDAFDPRLLKAHCVDGLTITNNTIRPSDKYPVQPAAEPFEATDCLNVTIENNVFGDAVARE